MNRYRKKPVVIEAAQLGWNSQANDEIRAWCGGEWVPDRMVAMILEATPILIIHTLEGTMAACRHDWIIKGVKGEFYPCKPDIFEATYELEDARGELATDA